MHAVLLLSLIALAAILWKQLWKTQHQKYGESQQALRDKLAAKGKRPWLERNKGLGVISLKNGTLLPENFDLLDAYDANTSIDLRDEEPLFSSGNDEARERGNELSWELEAYLQAAIPYPFMAHGGYNRVDIVRLEHLGNTAYAFVILQKTEGFAIRYGRDEFYYDLPTVLLALEAFIHAHPEMDEIIWLNREEGVFVFVVQQKLLQ